MVWGLLAMFNSSLSFMSVHFVVSYYIVYLCFGHFSDDNDECLAVRKVRSRDMIKCVILVFVCFFFVLLRWKILEKYYFLMRHSLERKMEGKWFEGVINGAKFLSREDLESS